MEKISGIVIWLGTQPQEEKPSLRVVLLPLAFFPSWVVESSVPDLVDGSPKWMEVTNETLRDYAIGQALNYLYDQSLRAP